MSDDARRLLESATAEIEAHVASSGWDQRPALFALVRARQLAADDLPPATAARLGLSTLADAALTPIEQEGLADGPLDDVLAQIGWPASVTGCALAQEIVILPPSAQAEVENESNIVQAAANHPDRREARLIVAVLRDGSSATMLRLRGTGAENAEADLDLLTGPDLAPNLVAALVATFEE